MDLTKATLHPSDLRDAVLSAASLVELDLRSFDLDGTQLSEARLWKSDLRSASLRGAVLHKAGLSQARLEGADLTGADLTDAGFFRTCFDSQTRWPAGFDVRTHKGLLGPGVDLSGANLKNFVLDAVDLRKALGGRPVPVPLVAEDLGTAAGLGASARDGKPSQRQRSPSRETRRPPGGSSFCSRSPSARSTIAT